MAFCLPLAQPQITNNMTFGHRLSQIRKGKDIRQEELANIVGTSKHMISRYERDAISPSIDMAAKIAKALNTSLDSLVFGIDLLNDTRPLTTKLQEIETLPAEDITHILAVIEAFITKNRLQQILK
ncbi:helix-turn-helix transcriptional regulator [Chitinophaga sp. XS-30]|nr:helix-turn-helix transcriptional regulator [Chitinophaga sp. XS-30]